MLENQAKDYHSMQSFHWRRINWRVLAFSWNLKASGSSTTPCFYQWTLHPTLMDIYKQWIIESRYSALVITVLESQAKGYCLIQSFHSRRINCCVSTFVFGNSKASRSGTIPCCVLLNPPHHSNPHMQTPIFFGLCFCFCNCSIGKPNQRALFDIILPLM